MLGYNMKITAIRSGYVGLVKGAAMKAKVVFDSRNLYRSGILEEAGFDHYGIGICDNIAEKV